MTQVTPSEFDQLTNDDQHHQFEILKNMAKFEVKSCTRKYCVDGGCEDVHYHYTIYRPIRPLPDYWQWYQKYMDEACPKGESRSVDMLEFSKNNYQLLYRWVTGACVTCGNHDYYWNEGDKHLEYYCPVCRDETIFIKGVWAYY